MAGIFGRLGRSIAGAADRALSPDTSTLGGRLSQFGAYLGAASGSPLGQATLAMQDQQREDARQRQNDLINAYYRQAQIQHLMQGPDEPSVVRTARAIGLQPGTDQFNRWVSDATMAPKFVTAGDGVYQMGGDYGLGQQPQPGSGAAIPTVSDQASYDAIPSGSQYRDPQGNVRTKR